MRKTVLSSAHPRVPTTFARRQPAQIAHLPFEQRAEAPNLLGVVAYLIACAFSLAVALNVCGVLV